MVALSRFASSSPVVALQDKVNGQPIRKSAEICDLRLARLERGMPGDILPFGDAAKEMIRATFGSTSRHQTAVNAAKALGWDSDTWERVMENKTGRIDGRLLFACLGAYQHRFKRPFPFRGGLGIAIVEVQE